MDATTIDANRRQQTELYGRPLGDTIRDLTTQLGVSQAKLAETLGLSAPMLSQLASAQRVKIGNPLVVARLQTLVDFAPLAGELEPAQRVERLAAIAAQAQTLTDRRVADPTAGLAAALAVIGSAAGLRAAADAAAPHGAVLAELLRAAADLADD